MPVINVGNISQAKTISDYAVPPPRSVSIRSPSPFPTGRPALKDIEVETYSQLPSGRTRGAGLRFVACGSHAAASGIVGGDRKAESQEESEYNVPKHSVGQANARSSLGHQVLENSAVKPDLQLTDETCEKDEDDCLYANNTQIASQVLKSLLFDNNKFKRD